ncbi:retrotransposon protein, putative, ty1-copia subclass [Tanacetum coccineum]
MDVKTAFLHGTLKEDVYVCQPKGFIDADHPSHVYKLKKALYGLKTPMEIKEKFGLDKNGTLVDATKYRSMIGTIMYLTSSRPEIIHATCLCARYQANPIENHLKEDYALETATRILYMVPTKKVDKTPYEGWYEKVPNFSYLMVWGCEALVKRDTPDKLQQRSVKCIFIGYPKETMGYYFYFLPENKIAVARYVEFLEKNLISQEVSEGPKNLKKFKMEIHHLLKTLAKFLWRLKISNHLKRKLFPFVDVMNAKMQSMKDNQVWCLVDLSPNYKTVGSKWLFKKKTDMDGIVHTYKDRLVAKGYTQTYRVNYEETFSPVADIRAIRLLIAIAAFYDYEIWQMHVKTAFLKVILMKTFIWCNLKVLLILIIPGKYESFKDPFMVLSKHQEAGIKDLMRKSKSLDLLKILMSHCFAMKDLGSAAFILGIKIYRDRSKRLIGLSQSAYMDKILKRFRMDTSKHGCIPMQERLDLNKTQGASTPEEVKRMQNFPYASAVGSITYATAMKTILKYLRNIKGIILVYGGNPKAELRVNCYCNAGFETNRDDIKSQTGYVSILNRGAVDWKSSKQSTTAMSAT